MMKLIWICMWLSIFIPFYLWSETGINILPNEMVPKSIVLENDSLYVQVEVGRYVYFTSFRDKISDTEFIDPAQPAPVVKLNNDWHLLQVGFNIWQVKKELINGQPGIAIEMFSDYLENPFHLFIRLWMSDQQELGIDLTIEHHAKEGLHDMGYVSRQTMNAGLSFLKYLKPSDTDQPYVIYKKGLEYFHNNESDVGMYFLRQDDAPTFPTVVSYPEKNVGVLLNKQQSDLGWSFDSANEALSFMKPMPVGIGQTFIIFRGTLRPFCGDWHAAFYWWKNWIRAQLDLSNYQRQGHLEYRKKVVGNFTMAFDHEFYDPESNAYRLDDFLARGEREFGGYDFILFWHGYPRMGVDSRDEWDMYQGLPGGVQGLKDLVIQAAQHNCWIFLSFNPWDVIGKKRDLVQAQADIMAKTGAQGTYLDIMRGASDAFKAPFERVNPDIVFSSENRPSFKGLQISTGSQEDHDYVLKMPRLDLLKFVLPEHCTSNTERMARNRTMQIRNTMFNLVGFTVWEDIFGEINRYSWDERVLIYRYNKLAHDHLDAFLTDYPEPLLTTRPIGASAGRNPFENAWQENPPTYDLPYPPTNNVNFTGLYVNKFPAKDKILYSLYHRDHDNVDRFHDNRLIGRLFKVNIPDGWHIVNIWDGLPVEIVVYKGEKWAYTNLELPDQSCFLVALPEKIVVEKKETVWTVRVPQAEGGELRLVGMDVDQRPIYAPEVPASRELSFSADQLPANVNGYLMIQYLKNKVVQDVTVVCIQE